MLDASYAWCTGIARTRATNFYYSFLLLDKQRRNAMCAVYAFMRICDDLSDGPGPKTADAFDQWRKQMEAALDGRFDGHPLWPAFQDTVLRYRIPAEYFHHMIDGVQSDLNFQAVESFDQLYQYCYRVASVVGLTVVHILGFRSPDALPLAEKCGVAFQLTNILRDVREDFENGRIYLPAEDLRRFEVIASHLGDSQVTPPLRALLEFQAARARGYYREAMPLLDLVEPEGRAMLRAIIEIYYSLLKRIEARGYEVLKERISVPKAKKLWILTRTALRPSIGGDGLRLS
ncbi:MAG TPA: phytoene/squalene synthase family protein [Bryobacteraceae bacterium]|nr:phytoene/squalene synthase family protein [Bryobacteraceae bacterium]